MYRAVVLLVGLLLCLAAAVVVLAPPGAPSWQPPAARPIQPDADLNTQSGARPENTLLLQASLSASRVQRWSGPAALVAALLAATGTLWLATRALARAPQRSLPAATLAAGQPAAPEPAQRFAGAASGLGPPAALDHDDAPTADAPPADGVHASGQPGMAPLPAARAPQPRHSAPPTDADASDPGPGADERARTDPALEWLRSEAGDCRAAAALRAVDEALAAGGWHSRAVCATTQPAAGQREVRIDLALHPAERAIAPMLAERIGAAHSAWHAGMDGAQITLQLPEQEAAPGTLLLPALQRDARGTRTHYLYAPAALGLAILGPASRDVLHGVLADLVCMYPPSDLGLTLFGAADAELYRGAPQWVEPPSMSPSAIERLAATLDEPHRSGPLRPVVLAAAEPDDELATALYSLLQRLAVLRAPPVALLVASERPGAQDRALAAALPSLDLRPTAGHTAELRYAERRIVGRPPRFEAGDMRELLRWLPRFGASPGPTIWDTIAPSAC